MAWVVTDHGNGNNTSGATLAKAVSANVLAGSVIVVAVYDKSVAASGGSMTDDAGNTYTAVSPTNPGASTSNGICQFFYSILGSQLNSGQNVTYTKQTSGSVCSISVLSATGGASSSILDTAVTAANTTNTNVSSPTSLTSGTPAVSGELFIAMSGEVQNNTTLSTDSGNGWAVPPAINNTGAACQVGGNQVNAGTGTKAWQPSSNKSGNWASIIIGLKPLASATLTAATGSFTETGNAGLFNISQLSAGTSYSETGVAALFRLSELASVGAFAETGNAGLFSLSQISGGTSYAETGNPALFKISNLASTGAFTETGNPALFTLNMPCAATSYAVTYNPATLATKLSSSAGAYLVTGGAALFPLALGASGGSYLVTGNIAELCRDYEAWFPRPFDSNAWTSGTIQSESWTPVTAQSEAWTAATKQAEAWTPATTQTEAWTDETPPSGESCS